MKSSTQNIACWVLPIMLLISPSNILPAYGQEDVASDGKVETRGTAPDSVEDARLPSGFVTRIPLDEVGPAGDGLASALERAPGVYVRRQSSFGQPAYIQVRGGNPRQVVVLLNGVRVKVPTGLGFDVGSLAVSGLDEARVYRGGSGVIHGAGALTGALELRAAPTYREGWEMRGRALTGSFGTTEFGARAEGSNEAGSARIVVNRRQSDGDFPFIDAQGVAADRVNNGHDRLHLLASGAWDGGGRYLGATVLLDTGVSGVAGPSEFQQTFGEATFRERRLIATSDGGARGVLSGDGWALDFDRVFGMQYRRQDYRNDEAILGGQPFETHASSVGIDSGANFSLYTDAGNFARVAVSARREAYTTLEEIDGVERLDVRRSTLGAAISDEQLLLDDKLSLIGVARLERLKQDSDITFPRTGALGAIYRAKPWIEFRGNFARTWRPPDFDELYIETEFIRGNPELEPERAWLGDAGITLRAKEERARAEIVSFWGRTYDQILFLPVSAYVIEARNLEQVNSAGIEFLGAFSPLARTPLSLSYTLTDARRPTLPDRVPLPNQPRHRLEAMARADLSQMERLFNIPKLQLETRASWRSEIALDNFASQTNPAWWRVDVGVVVSPVSWLRLRADGTNLLDHRRAVDGLQRPLSGRAFFVSMEFVAEAIP